MSTAAKPQNNTTLRWTVAATSFGFALVQLDVTIVNVALPAIGQSLGSGVAGPQWVVDAYALVFRQPAADCRLPRRPVRGAARLSRRPRAVCCRLP